MASEYVEIGVCPDVDGDVIEVGVAGDRVRVEFLDVSPLGAAVLLGPDEREQFQRLFMEAERRAEAHQAAS